jgi:hypothetical protein
VNTVPHRLLIIADGEWNDYDYLKEEFQRIASIRKYIHVVYPDDVRYWQLHIRDWCHHHPDQFKSVPYPRNPHTPRDEVAQALEERNYKMFWDELPDEVWKIESSKGYKHRPSKPIFPQVWNWARAMGIACITHRYPQSALKNNTYRRKPKSYYNGAM